MADLRGVLKGDLKGWERAFVDDEEEGALELYEEEEVPSRRRLGRGVEDIFPLLSFPFLPFALFAPGKLPWGVD